METKYDPYFLMLSTVFNVKKKEEMPARVIRQEGFKDFRIKIDLNNQNKEPLIITDDQYMKGEPLSFHQGNKVFSEDIIEKRKDNLGRVTVFYKGQEYISFDNFADYLNWLGIKK
jgi:hypothetical protein